MLFGLATRNKVRSAPRKARLRLEYLESRDAPAALTFYCSPGTTSRIIVNGVVSQTSNPGGQTILIWGVVNATVTTNSDGSFALPASPTTYGDIYGEVAGGSSNIGHTVYEPAPPVITSFTASQDGLLWDLQGTVSYGWTYSTLTVKFGGDFPGAQGVTVVPDDSGHFARSVNIYGQGSQGTLTAQATDSWGQTSNVAQDFIMGNPG
jgi:hypothetical protein